MSAEGAFDDETGGEGQGKEGNGNVGQREWWNWARRCAQVDETG